MPEPAPVCPKCSVALERGVVVDHAHYGLPMLQSWVAGVATKHWFTGLQVPRGRKMPVATWRCPSCGYLESYANRP